MAEAALPLRHALVVGASGVVGRYILSELLHEGWRATGMARDVPPELSVSFEIQAADLLDKASLQAALARTGEITHLFYSAYAPAANWAAATPANATMFANLIECVADSKTLQRVVLVTGTKAYGTHLGPVLTPIVESDPRHAPPNFYFDQADALSAASVGKRWTWNELRPHTLCGFSPGTPMSLVTTLAAYGAVCAELDVPMDFPGSVAAFDSLYQVTDARLFGRAAIWAATDERAINQAYNITNGDSFRWRRMWPQVARALGAVAGPPRPFTLGEFMRDKGSVWDAIVSRHGLKPFTLEQLANWEFGDYVLSTEWDILSSLTKSRMHGFNEVMDSASMFSDLFQSMRDDAVLPPLSTASSPKGQP